MNIYTNYKLANAFSNTLRMWTMVDNGSFQQAFGPTMRNSASVFGCSFCPTWPGDFGSDEDTAVAAAHQLQSAGDQQKSDSQTRGRRGNAYGTQTCMREPWVTTT